MDKTTGQVIYESTGRCMWDEENSRIKRDYEEMADAAIAHVRPQIEAEARAKVVEDVILAIKNNYQEWANIVSAERAIRALSPLPSGYVVVPADKANDSELLDFFVKWEHPVGEQDDDETGHTFYLMDDKDEYHGKTWREAIRKAMIAARAK